MWLNRAMSARWMKRLEGHRQIPCEWRNDRAVPLLLTAPTIPSGRMAASDQPELHAEGELRLRPWLDSDAPRVRAVYDDPAVQRWHARVLTSDQEACALITGWRQGWAEETEASWAVVDAADALLGRIALKSLDLHEGIADVAYWTTRNARGQGVCPRAVRATAEWAMRAGWHRLQIEHSVANHGSCRAADKAGFALEGTRRSAAPRRRLA